MYMLCITRPFIHKQNISQNYPVNNHNFRTVLDRSYPQHLGTRVDIVGNLYTKYKINCTL